MKTYVVTYFEPLYYVEKVAGVYSDQELALEDIRVWCTGSTKYREIDFNIYERDLDGGIRL